MKKLQIIAVFVLSLLFVLSCVSDDDDFWDEDLTDTMSGGNSGGNTSDTSYDEDLPDNQQNTDTDSADSGSSDTGDTDTSPDGGDSQPDKDAEVPDADSDTAPASDNDAAPAPDGDTETDEDSDKDSDKDEEVSDDNDPVNDNEQTDEDADSDDGDAAVDPDPDPEQLPECSPTSGTPCIDTSREPNLVWSTKSSSKMKWEAIEDHCATWPENEYEWRLPTISELRSLIQGCAVTQTSGSCKVTDGCTSYTSKCNDNCVDGCSGSSSFSKLGDTDTLWSGSVVSDDEQNSGWWVEFGTGRIKPVVKSQTAKVRCVKK